MSCLQLFHNGIVSEVGQQPSTGVVGNWPLTLDTAMTSHTATTAIFQISHNPLTATRPSDDSTSSDLSLEITST